MGALIATRPHERTGEPPRGIFPVRVDGAMVIDLCAADTAARFGIDTAHRAVRWLQDRAAGRPARTWRLSDDVHKAGADGMIYAARKRPDLSHLVLFAGPMPVTRK